MTVSSLFHGTSYGPGENQVWSKDGAPIEPLRYDRNHWAEMSEYWGYWKVRPSKGPINPGNICAKAGQDGPRSEHHLEGPLEYWPTYTGEDFKRTVVIDNAADAKA